MIRHNSVFHHTGLPDMSGLESHLKKILSYPLCRQMGKYFLPYYLSDL